MPLLTHWHRAMSGLGLLVALLNLVFIPLLLMYVFWIEGADGDFFVVVDCPESKGNLDFARFYPGDEFLKVLSTAPRDHPFAPPTSS
jgi:hypothetical protein